MTADECHIRGIYTRMCNHRPDMVKSVPGINLFPGMITERR